MGVVQGTNPLSYVGVAAPNPANVIPAQRAPLTTDINYAIGTLWIDVPSDDSYQLTSVVANVANWTFLGSAATPVNDVPHGGTGRNTLTNHGVLVGAGVNAITQLAVGATNSVLQGATGADPAFTTTPTVVSLNTTTSITAGTTLTATLGDIQATNGNLVLNTAGNKIVTTSIATTTAAGANSFGTVTLVGGTATIATTAVTANSKIVLSRQSVGATGAAALGILSIANIVANTSFDINAVQVADATALQASDVSVIFWMLIN